MSTKRIIISSISILLTILWICFIFSNSADTAAESSSKSETVQEIVNDVIDAVGGEGNVTEHAVRKFAHFFEFAVLSALFTADVLALGLIPLPVLPLKKKLYHLWLLLPLSASVALAVTDEALLQNLSEGRGPSPKDVLIDSLGALCGLILSVLIILLASAIYIKLKARSDPPTK